MSLPPTFVEGFHDPKDIKALNYRRLGKTDLMVSHIGIGGCSAGGEYGSVTEQQSIDTIKTAVKKGINYIDTSPGYGDGKSEIVIGKALRQLPRRSFYIATKVGRFGEDWKTMFDFSYNRVIQTVQTSLERFGVEYIDLVQVHDLEFALDLNQIVNETLPALHEMVKQGKVRYIGITGYPLSTLRKVVELSITPINTVLSYCRYTLLDQELSKHIQFFQSREIGIINASITAMSLLTSVGPPAWHPASHEIKAACREAVELCKDRGVELARLAVQFSVSSPDVSVNILGCDNSRILELNIDAATSQQTQHEKQLTSQVQKIFAGLSATHWEGIEIAEYRKALQQ